MNSGVLQSSVIKMDAVHFLSCQMYLMCPISRTTPFLAHRIVKVFHKMSILAKSRNHSHLKCKLNVMNVINVRLFMSSYSFKGCHCRFA